MKCKKPHIYLTRLYQSYTPYISLDRYEIMMSCWSLDSHARPLFKDLVGSFSGLLERESDYLELSAQSLCWKETVSHTPPPSSPPTAALPVTQEQEIAAAENEAEDEV